MSTPKTSEIRFLQVHSQKLALLRQDQLADTVTLEAVKPFEIQEMAQTSPREARVTVAHGCSQCESACLIADGGLQLDRSKAAKSSDKRLSRPACTRVAG